MGKMKDLYITEMNEETLCPLCNRPMKLIKEKTSCSGVQPRYWLCEPCKKAVPLVK